MNVIHVHADSSDSANVIHVLNRSFANEERQDVSHCHSLMIRVAEDVVLVHVLC